MHRWSQRSDWILEGFVSNSKRCMDTMAELTFFCNGNSEEDIIVHYCKPGCCDSDATSLERLIRLAVPLLSRGYPVPLLYRFKHYSVASSYIKTACCFFSILPRILSQMAKNSADKTDAASRLSGVVDAILQQSEHKGHFTQTDEGGDIDLVSRLDDLLENDLSFSLQNSLRKQLVSQQIAKPTFRQSAIMIDLIVSCLEYGTHVFLQRTTWLTRISVLGRGHKEYGDLVQRSMQSFLRVVNGSLGETLISRLIHILNDGLCQTISMGLDNTSQRLLLLFKLVIACSTDLWRRMIFEFSSYPYKMFRWLSHEQSMADFLRCWEELANLPVCCVDRGMSGVLLSEFRGCSPGSQRDEILDLLRHIAAFTPVNSDKVEVKHGNMQWAVSQRGAQYVKQGKSALETSLLQSTIRQHVFAHRDAFEETMPSRMTISGIKRQVGVKSKNQFSGQERVEQHRNPDVSFAIKL